jgi:hypothetical protein
MALWWSGSFLLAGLRLVEPAAVIGSNVVTLGATHGLSVDLSCSMSHHGDPDPRLGSHEVAVGNGVVERPARFKTSRGGVWA